MEIQWSLVLFTVVAGAGAWQFAAAMIEALAKKDELRVAPSPLWPSCCWWWADVCP